MAHPQAQQHEPWLNQDEDATTELANSAASSRQASGAAEASPSSQLSSGCAVGCTTRCIDQAAVQLRRSDNDAVSDVSSEGWFSKCRGCGCMTAHEKTILGTEVPFCRRCEGTLRNCPCPAMRAKMVDALVYVHQEWSNAGL